MDNTNIARTLYDAFNNKNLNKVVPVIADELQWNAVPFNKQFKGKDGYLEYFGNWAKAFPDGKCEIKNLIGSGNFVVVEFIGRGTNTGELQTPKGQLSPTGKKVEMPFCDVLQFRGGKVVSATSYFDAASMMQQLGVEAVKAAA